MTPEWLRALAEAPWLILAFGLGWRAIRRLQSPAPARVRIGSPLPERRAAVPSHVVVRAFKGGR